MEQQLESGTVGNGSDQQKERQMPLSHVHAVYEERPALLSRQQTFESDTDLCLKPGGFLFVIALCQMLKGGLFAKIVS